MPKMIALKPFTYPRGRDGKKIEVGDEVEIGTDREAKVMRLLKQAKDAAPTETKVMSAKTEGAALARTTTDAAPAEPPAKRSYRRSDMTPEGE